MGGGDAAEDAGFFLEYEQGVGEEEVVVEGELLEGDHFDAVGGGEDALEGLGFEVFEAGGGGESFEVQEARDVGVVEEDKVALRD